MGFAQGFFFGCWALAGVVWWVVDLELSPLRLILLGTFLEGTVWLAESPTGVVADVFSRKWSVVLSWVMIGGGMIVGPATDLFVVMLVAQVIWGVGFTFQSGADTAWVTDELGYEDDRIIFRHAIARVFGVIVGVVVAMAASQWSLRGAMILAGMGSIVFAGGLAATMTEKNFQPIESDKDRSILSRAGSTWAVMARTWRQGLSVTMSIPVLRLLAVATFVAATVDEMVDRLDMKRVIEVGFPDQDGETAAFFFGIIWIVMSLATLPVMLAFNRDRENLSDRWSAIALSGLLASSAVGVAMMAGPALAVALIGWTLRDVVREVAMPVATAWTNRQAPSDIRATVLSFQSQSVAFGQMAGGLAMGALAQATSLAAAFIVGAGLLTVTSISVAFFGTRTGPAHAV